MSLSCNSLCRRLEVSNSPEYPHYLALFGAAGSARCVEEMEKSVMRCLQLLFDLSRNPNPILLEQVVAAVWKCKTAADFIHDAVLSEYYGSYYDSLLKYASTLYALETSPDEPGEIQGIVARPEAVPQEA